MISHHRNAIIFCLSYIWSQMLSSTLKDPISRLGVWTCWSSRTGTSAAYSWRATTSTSRSTMISISSPHRSRWFVIELQVSLQIFWIYPNFPPLTLRHVYFIFHSFLFPLFPPFLLPFLSILSPSHPSLPFSSLVPSLFYFIIIHKVTLITN